MEFGTRFRRSKRFRRFRQLGFTLIEILVVIAVASVLAAIATPNLLSVMDNAKVDQTIAEVRSSLQDTQRQAIRQSRICALKIDLAGSPGSNSHHGSSPGSGSGQNSVSGTCLTSGDRNLPSGIDMATNILETSGVADAKVRFGILGNAEFHIESNEDSLPTDPSGKIIAFVAQKNSVKKKCIAISSTLGLTRVGTYVGNTSAEAITENGVCTALDWDRQ